MLDVSVRQRYGENRLVYRLLEIVEWSQIVRVVQIEWLVFGYLIAELTNGVANRVHHVHQLSVAG